MGIVDKTCQCQAQQGRIQHCNTSQHHIANRTGTGEPAIEASLSANRQPPPMTPPTPPYQHGRLFAVQQTAMWVAIASTAGLNQQLLVMIFTDPRGCFRLSHSFTTASTGTARRSSREKGAAAAGQDCRSFYPVLLPKPGLRYQLARPRLQWAETDG